MEVSHGADTDRLEAVGLGLTSAHEGLAQVGARGHSSFEVLQEAWQGPDVGHFHQQWGVASRSLEGCGDLLRRMAAELLAQAEQQRRASEGGGAAGGPGASGDDVRQPDDNDANDVKWWYPPWVVARIVLRERRGYYDNHEDPGPGNTRLPEGADPDDPIIQELLETAEGRATLDWMARNGIEMVIDPAVEGGYYVASENTFYMKPTMWQAQGLIHEAAHARQDVEDISPEVTEVSKHEYVEGMLEMEADAMVAEAHYWRDVVENDPSRAEDMPDAQVQYWRIYNERIDAGATPEEADAAGRTYLKEDVRTRHPSTGEEGETSEQYYGDAWENAN